MNEREFINCIKGFCGRRNAAALFRRMLSGLGAGACVGIILQGISMVLPFYYVNLCTVLAVCAGTGAAFVFSCFHRSDMKQTALAMDRFGFAERISTAYDHMQESGEMILRQRQDAMAMLQAKRGQIRFRVCPPVRQLAVTGLLLAVMAGMVFIPTKARKQAAELHQVQLQAEEKQQEVQEVVDELTAFEQGNLTDAQRAAMQEMIENLQASMEEFGRASSGEDISNATEKLEYKYQNMGSQLSDIAQSLPNGAAGTMTAEAMQAYANQLQQMGGVPADQFASNQGTPQGGENGSDGQNGNSQNGQTPQGGQNGNGQNGQTPQGGQNGNGQSGNGQTGNDQNGNGQGEDGAAGQAQAAGEADAAGQGQTAGQAGAAGQSGGDGDG